MLFRGRNNFDKCGHKTVEHRTTARPITDGPVYVASLTCPNEEGNRLSVGDRERSRDYETSDRLLRSCAASVCRSCVLVDLSPPEVEAIVSERLNQETQEETQLRRTLDVLRNTLD